MSNIDTPQSQNINDSTGIELTNIEENRQQDVAAVENSNNNQQTKTIHKATVFFGNVIAFATGGAVLGATVGAAIGAIAEAAVGGAAEAGVQKNRNLEESVPAFFASYGAIAGSSLGAVIGAGREIYKYNSKPDEYGRSASNFVARLNNEPQHGPDGGYARRL